ncbi:unnamed protein product [Protopolystoma xenopodis]|uniref:Uncharacterized protein n=1 Tax=Protopolystoma xenopodis TaxID=117903 RepID=A0A448X1F4_9PLAT|nr:unnamed protein product [Protopolystoma xenopodis]
MLNLTDQHSQRKGEGGATELDSDDHIAWYHLGVELAIQRRLDEALGACQRALYIEPSHTNTLRLLALLYTASRNHLHTSSSASLTFSQMHGHSPISASTSTGTAPLHQNQPQQQKQFPLPSTPTGPAGPAAETGGSDAPGPGGRPGSAAAGNTDVSVLGGGSKVTTSSGKVGGLSAWSIGRVRLYYFMLG